MNQRNLTGILDDPDICFLSDIWMKHKNNRSILFFVFSSHKPIQYDTRTCRSEILFIVYFARSFEENNCSMMLNIELEIRIQRLKFSQHKRKWNFLKCKGLWNHIWVRAYDVAMGYKEPAWSIKKVQALCQWKANNEFLESYKVPSLFFSPFQVILKKKSQVKFDCFLQPAWIELWVLQAIHIATYEAMMNRDISPFYRCFLCNW